MKVNVVECSKWNFSKFHNQYSKNVGTLGVCLPNTVQTDGQGWEISQTKEEGLSNEVYLYWYKPLRPEFYLVL